MFARCSAGASRNSKYASKRLPLRRCTRSNSSTSAGTPKSPPHTQDRSRSKYAPRRLVIAIFSGAGLIAGWQLYNIYGKDSSFAAYSLLSKERVSSTASIFHLKPEGGAQDFERYTDARKRGIWNVHFKQPQLQIVRAYTPLPPLDSVGGEKQRELRFLIRNDPHGEVSGYLHRLPIGAEVEMRGPNVEYEFNPDVRQIVFLAGGTGIAPALQAAYALFEGNKAIDGDQTNKDKKLHILWASRMREDCLGGVSDAPPAETVPPKPTWSGFFSTPKAKPPPPVSQEQGLLVKELEALKKKYPGQVTVEYFVNAEDTWIDEDAVLRALSRFDGKDFTTGMTTPQEQRQILISGPPGFISYLAGPKEWRNGREEQGSVSKIVAHAISKNPHNVKVWKI
ncbi:hypothetical protein A1O3_07429 [Capronia epimyces CBS 606.96]|uniref:FAD-binding FR-type domain-containing protein n=1 Tax=Capronia epimyces CBS 606.96 TaxID=1182542 RepID=W9XVV2_9EURO|nr:uncharacterized protein A1O3_07429 [Capronia epimyces CBS 606.96]EXJ81141.1 hypothetical protein A1O3_07429 [Capronia epimyces CBS 606.96]